MGANDYFVQTPEQRAWSEARAQYEMEVWDRIDRRVSDLAQAWRLCTVRHCRRRKCCSDDSFVCLDILHRERPSPELTEEQRALLKFKLRKKIERGKAELAAQGIDVGERRAKRIEELKREKLMSYGIVPEPVKTTDKPRRDSARCTR
jgi:hypothetical protein